MHKSRFENLKEINTHEIPCLHLINPMELIEKTELFRGIPVYAFSKSHLNR